MGRKLLNIWFFFFFFPIRVSALSNDTLDYNVLQHESNFVQNFLFSLSLSLSLSLFVFLTWVMVYNIGSCKEVASAIISVKVLLFD
jgi:cell division protein FtsB